MKRYAAIDIGTNSMRLLLATLEGNQLVHREKHLNTTRIGYSVDAEGKISTEGLETNLRSFKTFVDQARSFGAENIWAIATSAVRDAKNGMDFVAKALEETGVLIEIIDGETEAQMGYQGVLMGLENPQAFMRMIDIGGGSTEFILGDANSIFEANSFNVGALRMTERYITTDPVTEEEYQDMVQGIRHILEAPLLKGRQERVHELIGIGGTATTIAAIHQKLEPYNPDLVHGYSMGIEEIRELAGQLKAMTIAERMQVKGLQPKRADIILAGITIMLVSMELLGISKLTISEYDNLEGLLHTKLK